MTLFTSDRIRRIDRDAGRADRELKIAFMYLIIAVFLAIAGGIYEHFSFGVYSYFMIYAFMAPLAGGALPFMIMHMRKVREGAGTAAEKNFCDGAVCGETCSEWPESRGTSNELYETGEVRNGISCAGEARGKHASGRAILNELLDSELLYHAAIATLTVGSIMHGALEICGRPNSLTVVYPAVACILLIICAVSKFRERTRSGNNKIAFINN